MGEGTELAIRDEVVQLGTIQTRGPADVIQRASSIATALADIIDKRNLYTILRGKKFVMVEGWSTLGAMLGVLPREVSADRLEDGGYLAVVELVRANDGAIIGRGSALCGMDEVDRKGNLTWGARPEYARRSMAITRATGKAYRLGFSWIMALAGYEPTPAEEIIEGQFSDVAEESQPKPKTKAETNGRPLEPDRLKGFIALKIAQASEDRRTTTITEGHVKSIVDKLQACFAGQTDADLKRHSVTGWLIGKESVKDFVEAEYFALLDWLVPKEHREYGTWDLHPAAYAEAAAILKEALKDAGQEELPL